MITATVVDLEGNPDNTSWRFATALRESGDRIVTEKTVTVKPADGVLSVDLEPGPATVTFNGHTFPIVVPAGDADLWDLISVNVEVPADTPAQVIQDAITTYLQANPIDGGLP